MFCWLGTIWCTHFLLDKHIPSHIYLRGKGRLNHPQLIKSLFILLPFLFTLFFSNSSVWMTLEDTLVGLLSLGRTASAHILTGSLRDERSNQLGFLTGFRTQGAQACEELQISLNKFRPICSWWATIFFLFLEHFIGKLPRHYFFYNKVDAISWRHCICMPDIASYAWRLGYVISR